MTTLGIPALPAPGPPPPAAQLPAASKHIAAAAAIATKDVPGVRHYEQTTQAMALKDAAAARRRLATTKKKPMRGINPNEVAIPDGLKPDEKDRLLQEIKKKWQADFGQRIRYEEANRVLREQVAKLAARVDELEGGGEPHAAPDDAAAAAPGDARARVRRNDAQFTRLGAQLKRATGKLPAPAPPAATGHRLGATDDETLRQTNVIVVLTRRNKELLGERKKMEELLHAKTVQAEGEVRRAEKLDRALELERNKFTRDRTKLEAQIEAAGRVKAGLDDRVRELERKLEHAARVRLSLEHQVAGLRDKLDSLMIDYSDVVAAVPVGDDEGMGSPQPARKRMATNASIAGPPVEGAAAGGEEDDKVKQARLALEYETWVRKKRDDAGASPSPPPPPPHPSHPAAAPRARKRTIDDAAARRAAETEAQRAAEAEAAEAEERRRQQAEDDARRRAEEEARAVREAEDLARVQREAEAREQERVRQADEEIARQQAEMEAEQAAQAAAAAAAGGGGGGKKKKGKWGR
ncbi:hypothetical protein H9P43_006911 [Blastocladiella emersonii ATCC 22665]|nr:hypothetical protein H9P43_006911 [Blastocladiella emersonii ATCC 22665]